MTTPDGPVSEAVQHDLDRLRDLALGVGQRQLEGVGTVHPYAVAITVDGEETVIGMPETADRASPEQVRELTLDALRQIREQLRAAAVVTGTHLDDLATDALRVELEHAQGHALVAQLPYRTAHGVFAKPSIHYGDLRVVVGTPEIWASVDGR